MTISANPASINAGAATTLTVAAANASQVTIVGSDGTSYQLPGTGGTQSVTPAKTTTYTATASGQGGSATATATVQVAAAQAATVNITANPASITAGTSSTLTVTATNATTVTITGSDGSTYNLAATGGTQSVTPTATTTYTATAVGATGSVTATATVSVTPVSTPAPTVTITADPASITMGTTTTLTVAATNATTVTISGSDGTKYTLASAAGGTQTVSPNATTTYTATATGAGGTQTANVVVTVLPPAAPTVTITAQPPSITDGSSSTLNVTATNATSITITGSDGSSYPIAGTAGAQSVSPTKNTTYTATATGPGGTATASVTVDVTAVQTPTVSIAANPATVVEGNPSTLTVTATNASSVTVTGTDGTTYTLQPNTGATGTPQSVTVTPASTTTYTATATGNGSTVTAQAVVTVTPPGNVQAIDHVIFMLQENRSFDSYFGMLNPYRKSNNWNIGADGNEYDVDGLADVNGNLYPKANIPNQDDENDPPYSPFKLTSTCIDDATSAWLASYGDANRYNFTAQPAATARTIQMNGFVHNAEGYAKSCAASKSCSGTFNDTTGRRAMGYYDQGFLNYYYYMASQFALSDRWFSPISSKTADNRVAVFSGGTTQGLTKDPGSDDHFPQLQINTIFQELDQAKVSWKIYYTATQGFCEAGTTECGSGGNANYPATWFTEFSYSYQYLYENPTGAPCTGTTQGSKAVGDPSNSFCIDTSHIAPLPQYYQDLKDNTLPSFAFIESGSGLNDEHPGSGQSILLGQAQVAQVINAFMGSKSWNDSVFFFSYDEPGGPFDHVPPIPGHTNDFTDAALGTYPDISSIAVNADSYKPCLPNSTVHCDLSNGDPGTNANDAPAVNGFAAQLGFRLPNMVVSPFTRAHYVSHVPMDHTAVIKFVESRFIGSSANLTNRDAAQPNLLNFFDFNNIPWSTPPSPPAPVTASSLGYDPCQPDNMGP